MAGILVGYARSTDKQDLDAQREALTALGVATGRIYPDRGLTGTSRARPGPAGNTTGGSITAKESAA